MSSHSRSASRSGKRRLRSRSRSEDRHRGHTEQNRRRDYERKDSGRDSDDRGSTGRRRDTKRDCRRSRSRSRDHRSDSGVTRRSEGPKHSEDECGRRRAQALKSREVSLGSVSKESLGLPEGFGKPGGGHGAARDQRCAAKGRLVPNKGLLSSLMKQVATSRDRMDDEEKQASSRKLQQLTTQGVV